MSQTLVSVIIPAFNSKNYLEETINSVLSQTYKPIEIILIDDGSTDDTKNLFPKLEDEGVACYTIANGGASNARNFGLSKAKGTYIQFLDADDIILESKIEKQLEAIRLHNADICYAPWINFKNVLGDNQTEFRFSRIDHTLPRTGKELMISFGMENWFIPTLAWLVKKELIESAGEWDINIINNNDGEYFSRVLFLAKKVVCCKDHLAYYRLTPNSLGKLNSGLKIDSAFKSYRQIENLVLQCSDVRLMSYPKRLYYMQFRRIRTNYPKLARRAANNFDRIQAPSFLSKKVYYWKFINWFGLYQGTRIYKLLQPLWGLLLKIKPS